MLVSVTYDMWSPAFAEVPLTTHYAEMLRQVEYAEQHGFEAVSFNEHHGSEGGYNPCPLIAATAVAARTSRIKLRPLLLVPLRNPLRLAEELAVVDNIAGGGRLEPVFGAGYRPEEFAMFGKSLGDRRRAVDGACQLMRKAWTGEWFEHEGQQVRVTPRPAGAGPKILLGGATKVAARAAARYADGFYPIAPAFWPAYREACLELGKPDPGTLGKRSPMFFHVAEDPEAVWPRIAPYILAAAKEYRSWTLENMPVPPQFAVTNEAELRESGQYVVLTPDEAVAMLEGLGPDGQAFLRPQWGGFHPDLGWESLRLFAEKVMPRVSHLLQR
jgi:alkanesulfonate monooxygenase SsuD/methylene tetrahydromethanopterin reductase-like flavin-dependent oxidoreductase (luciferase family)